MTHYLVFGDSVTQGFNDLTGGWVQRLRESLTLDDYVYNLGVDPIPWEPNLSYRSELVRQYNQAMKAVAEAEKLKFVDLFNLLPPEYIRTLADGVHPDAAGHAMIFNLVKDVLK